MRPTFSLTIASTWDGLPVADEDAARVSLTLTDAHLHLAIDAPWRGDPPPPGPPGARWRLWEHEVVEVFIVGEGARYTEIEIGPHGHFLVLQLEGYRAITARELPLDCAVTREGPRWRAEARLDRALLPSPPFTVNAYAIHGQGDARRYLAAHPVPGDAPDFHRLERFVPWP